MEETSVLLNNIRDEFNPEPRKIKKGKKVKAKKSKKSSKDKNKEYCQKNTSERQDSCKKEVITNNI
jgi:hypothetical protein